MSHSPVIRVAGVQMEPKFAEVSLNRTALINRLGAAAADGARLVVFPECALTGYGFDSREEALRCAEAADGPSSQAIKGACKRLGVSVVYGFLEADGDRLFNALALVTPRGLTGVYRKIHLPFVGADRWVDPGDRPLAVHEVEGLKVGMHICYDGSFPETGRVLSLLGADLLVLPTNWPNSAETAAEHMIATRALENTVYAMAVNRVGEERGFHYIGRSSIAAPDGQVLAVAGANREQTITADIDPAKARQKRLIRVPGLHEIDRFADRRPAFYGPIVEPVKKP